MIEAYESEQVFNQNPVIEIGKSRCFFSDGDHFFQRCEEDILNRTLFMP